MDFDKLISEIGIYNARTPLELDPSALPLINVGFSPSGIDAAIARTHLKSLVQNKRKGFYVDIGCGHPIERSNTYLFYALGWSGLCVDANGAHLGYFKTTRPRDIVIHSGIAAETGSKYFAVNKAILGMSQVKANKDEFGKDFERPVPIDCITLTDLFDRHLPPNTSINLMSIDIEGSETDALKSNDWRRFRPSYIVAETLDTSFKDVSDHPIVSYMKTQHYDVVAFFGGDVLIKDTLPSK